MTLLNTLNKIPTEVYVIGSVAGIYLLLKSGTAETAGKVGANIGGSVVDIFGGFGSGVNDSLGGENASLGTWLYDSTHDNEGKFFGEFRDQFNSSIDMQFENGNYSNPVYDNVNDMLTVITGDNEETFGGWLFDNTQRVKSWLGDEKAKAYMEYVN